MTKKSCSTLLESAETLTQIELCQAPELPALIALDANLLAVIKLLEFQIPYLCHQREEPLRIEVGIEEHIANSICILANALRKNLAAYYAIFRESDDECTGQQEISF